MRVCGIAETDNENISDIVVRVAKDKGVDISPNDISVSHRVGGPRRGRSDKTRPMSTYRKSLRKRTTSLCLS